MPKTKKVAPKAKKQKLTPAERSDVAKARWAKRREAEVPEIAGIATNIYYAPPETGLPVQGFIEPQDAVMGVDTSIQEDNPAVAIVPAPQPPEQPPVTPEPIAPGMSGTPENLTPFRPAPSANFVPYTAPDPAPQPAPAATKKVKRYTGPKEFSVALKAAESRLAKAIVERAEAAGKLAALQAEIPSLVQIINALRGPQNIAPGNPYDFVPHDFKGNYFPQALSGDVSVPQYVDPLAAIAGAAAAPPVSRAQGGAIQFSPEVLGSLEGPDDDEDTDKYITGPLAGGGWK